MRESFDRHSKLAVQAIAEMTVHPSILCLHSCIVLLAANVGAFSPSSVLAAQGIFPDSPAMAPLKLNPMISEMEEWTTQLRWRHSGRSAASHPLKGSWDLVTRVINKVTILIITYNPN